MEDKNTRKSPIYLGDKMLAMNGYICMYICNFIIYKYSEINRIKMMRKLKSAKQPILLRLIIYLYEIIYNNELKYLQKEPGSRGAHL